MATDESRTSIYWARTVGGPTTDDRRNRELHQFFGTLPEAFDLEPWEDQSNGVPAHFVRDESSPPDEEDDRIVWRYVYTPR